jgi:hypothetical protein
MARLVPKIIALESPWNIRRTIRKEILREKIIRKVETVNNEIPIENTFFLPIISASLPKGNRNIAEDKIKLLTTHPRLIAFAWRSLPIEGKARFTAELRKGVKNAAKVATRSTDLLDVISWVISALIFGFYIYSDKLQIFFLSSIPLIPSLLYQ